MRSIGSSAVWAWSSVFSIALARPFTNRADLEEKTFSRCINLSLARLCRISARILNNVAPGAVSAPAARRRSRRGDWARARDPAEAGRPSHEHPDRRRRRAVLHRVATDLRWIVGPDRRPDRH